MFFSCLNISLKGLRVLLSEKTKSFIERVANNLQHEIMVDSPNLYDINSIIDFVNSMGCSIEFEKGCNRFTINDECKIYLEYDLSEIIADSDILIKVLRVIFHEIWHFISSRIFSSDSNLIEGNYNEDSLSVNEASANYFSRAMLLPENIFVQSVINNIDSNGMCNIFEVASYFNVDYTDVIARGNDLNLWNNKGGM